MRKPVLYLIVMIAFGCGQKSKIEQPANDTIKTTFEPKTETLDEDRPSPLKRTTGQIAGMTIVIRYGSPAVKNRQIWGSLVPYNEIWRSGANEATNIEFPKDVLIEGKPLPAGKYGFFTIPTKEEWTLIFNGVWDQWGAYDYDPSRDVLRINVKPETLPQVAERLDFVIEKDGIAMIWDRLKIKFSVESAGNS